MYLQSPATIMIVRPMKKNDATENTYKWGGKAVQIAKDLGYNVIDIQKDNATYENVSEQIKMHRPRVFSSFSHGCVSSLQGQHSCTITRKYSPNELIKMAESNNPVEREKLLRLLKPVQMSCQDKCRLQSDICDSSCPHDTNVNLLKDTICFAVACHTAAGLGKCAIAYGATAYLGYKDLYLFPVDSKGTQDKFGDIQLIFFKELLMGKSVYEAEKIMRDVEDDYIRKNKKVKYLAVPALWDQVNRLTLGKDARIYE